MRQDYANLVARKRMARRTKQARRITQKKTERRYLNNLPEGTVMAASRCSEKRVSNRTLASDDRGIVSG